MHAGVGIAIRAIGQAPQAATFNTILPRWQSASQHGVSHADLFERQHRARLRNQCSVVEQF